MLVEIEILLFCSQTVVDTHMWDLFQKPLFWGIPLSLILYLGLVSVRAKHIDSAELGKGITLYVSRQIRRVIGKRLEVNSKLRSVPNDMTDRQVLIRISRPCSPFPAFSSNHRIFNFSKSTFFDTSIIVPFVILDQALSPWRRFNGPNWQIAAFRKFSWSISLCNN